VSYEPHVAAPPTVVAVSVAAAVTVAFVTGFPAESFTTTARTLVTSVVPECMPS
jgi:type III secretory pathway component EscV